MTTKQHLQSFADCFKRGDRYVLDESELDSLLDLAVKLAHIDGAIDTHQEYKRQQHGRPYEAVIG